MIEIFAIIIILFILALIIFNVKVDDSEPDKILMWYTFKNQRRYFILWKS